MAPKQALVLALLGLSLEACQCSPDDGWPHLEDHLWRVALDPDGAHAFTDSSDAAPVVLMKRGDDRGAEVLLMGYRGTERSTISTARPAWRDCEAPALPSGLRTATPAESPEHPGIAWLGPATRVEIPTPPANRSATVVEAGEALQALVQPPPELTVRSVLKQRRPQAPPLLLVAGDAGCTGVVAVLDSDFEPVASDVLQLPGPRCAPMAAMPPADLDGDQVRELVVRAGNGEPGVGTFRAVYHLHTDPVSLSRVWHAELTPSCD